MQPNDTPAPHPGIALDFLNAAFEPYEAAGGLIEIAHSGTDGGAINRAALFDNTAEGRRAAAEHAATVNAEPGVNVYFAPSLRLPTADRRKRARKTDVLGSSTPIYENASRSRHADMTLARS